jgi:hypothetical protein
VLLHRFTQESEGSAQYALLFERAREKITARGFWAPHYYLRSENVLAVEALSGKTVLND